MEDLLPKVHLIVRNLIDITKMRDSGYDDMETILYFIILFNLNEYPDEYKEWTPPGSYIRKNSGVPNIHSRYTRW